MNKLMFRLFAVRHVTCVTTLVNLDGDLAKRTRYTWYYTLFGERVGKTHTYDYLMMFEEGMPIDMGNIKPIKAPWS